VLPEIELLIAGYMVRYRIPGLSVAVARRNTPLYAAGYGFANVEHRVAATATTVYQTSSVGKQFTAALLMLLTERGFINIDDRIERLFDDIALPKGWGDITVRHLLTHTSGISDAAFDQLNWRLDYTDGELLRIIAAGALDFAPGTRWNYSNCGYMLLGILVSRVTGRFYGDVLSESIFAPLKMSTARVNSEADIIPYRAAGYRLRGQMLINQEYVSPTLNSTADGSVCASVLDLVKWDRALQSDVLLSQSSREAMWTTVEMADGSQYPYGFGWSVRTSPYGRLVEHEGAWQGFASHFSRYTTA